MNWEIIAGILSGLIVCVPLVIKLVQVTKEAIKNKNWNQIVKIIVTTMEEAEKLMESGADKKQYVISVVKGTASNIDYDMTEADWAKVSDMIDMLCEMAKIVNSPKSQEQE